MYRSISIVLFALQITAAHAQLMVARDTVKVIENGYVLKMPWANGINFSNVSNIDFNFDGKKDLVLFDRINQFGTGRFRCFLNTGNAGPTQYRVDLNASYYFPQASNWAILRDYDRDGKEDLFCSTSAGIKVYRNTGSSGVLKFTLMSSLLNSDYNPGGAPYMSNLYASSVGVPGIADIDKDGDLDILTFSPQGVFIEFHRNMSKEKFGTSDSLVFEIGDLCWGKISENNCTITMGQCVQKPGSSKTTEETETLHSGSCLMCLDSDGDKDEDLIMGDISCNSVQYVHNTGTTFTASFTDSTKMYPNYPLKNNTVQVKLNNFPCTYFVNIDTDTIKDLVATPNSFGSENYKSVWYYKNTSLTSTVNFQFVKNNFLQDEMIEVGQNSYPLLFDYNADGKKDLLIGTFGYYSNNTLSARLTLYANIGTASVPSFSLVSRDYGNLGLQNLNNVMPTAGDIDGDGDIDLCVGVSSGQIHWLENTAGPGFTCNFSVFKNNPFNFTTASAVAAPQLFDLNNDGKLDLLIGGKNGKIAYYQNIGITSIPSFSLVSNALGNINVQGDQSLYGLDGYAAPFFYKENGITKCLVGSISGNIWHYLVPSNLAGAFTLISNSEDGLNEGSQSTVWYEDLDGDNKRDLIVGNASGGLTYFSSSSKVVSLNEIAPGNFSDRISVFPNPANNCVQLKIENTEINHAQVDILDLSGRQLIHKELNSNFEIIDVSDLQNGFYFLRVTLGSEQSFRSSTKIIVKE
ncbi:MAG: T9SS type A sorting domain-containing protein [bacterium]|nr:T9SS type A sorting domain-containing protein [bacterium]